MIYLQQVMLYAEILSFLLVGFCIWVIVSIYQIKKEMNEQKEELEQLKKQHFRLKRSIKKKSNEDDDEEEEYCFMNQKFD